MVLFSEQMDITLKNEQECSICLNNYTKGHIATRSGEDKPKFYCPVCFEIINKDCNCNKEVLEALSNNEF